MNAVAQVVVPVFGTVALGYGLARSGLFEADTGSALVRFMYYLAIPAMLFKSVAGADLPPSVPWAFLGAFYLPVLAVFALAMRTAQGLLEWPPRDAVMAGMTAAYANIVLLGYPLVLAAFGDDGAVPLFMLLATQSIVLFPLTTWQLEKHRAGRTAGWRTHAHSLLRLARNPVIVSLILGIGANLGGWQPDAISARMLALLSAAGPGCALIALGISLAQYRLGGSYRAVAWLVVLKNLCCPAVVWLGCVAAGIADTWRDVAVLLAAMPCGINAFIFASQYGLRQAEVAKSIVVSTALSSAVVTVLLALLLD